MQKQASEKWAEIKRAVSAVDWSNYETAYGNAAEDIPYTVPAGGSRSYMPKVEQSLAGLFSDDKKTALQASHDLWCGLCHQHAFLSSSALPAFDILLYALQNLSDDIKVELLDIFYGFAACTARGGLNAWEEQLRYKLIAHRQLFQAFTGHPNEDIAAFAGLIVDLL